MVMTDANAFFAMCRPDQSILGVAGWLAGCLLASLLTCAMCHVLCVCMCICAQQCIGESVLEPHLIYVISHLSHLTWLVPGPGPRTRSATQLCVHTPLHLSL